MAGYCLIHPLKTDTDKIHHSFDCYWSSVDINLPSSIHSYMLSSRGPWLHCWTWSLSKWSWWLLTCCRRESHFPRTTSPLFSVNIVLAMLSHKSVTYFTYKDTDLCKVRFLYANLKNKKKVSIIMCNLLY